MKWIVNIAAAVLLAFSIGGISGISGTAQAAGPGPVVVLETNQGTIMLLLNESKAPKTVANFLRYVDSHYYDGMIFHRVIKNFMIQGGGCDVNLLAKPAGPPITNEADNGLENKRGTIAMARTSDPQSATSQFFINLKDNHFLDYRSSTPQGWGYAVFGRVISGMNVVDHIATMQTESRGGMQDVPVQPVIIKRAYRRTE